MDKQQAAIEAGSSDRRVESSQVGRGEPQRVLSKVRLAAGVCFADEGARRDVMDHSTGDKKRARRLDPARQSERYTWMNQDPRRLQRGAGTRYSFPDLEAGQVQ